MSPAVSTATATAAAAMAPTARRKVTLLQTRPTGMSSSADSSSSGSTVRKPTPTRKTTQGKQASAWMIAAPVRPTSTGRSPISLHSPRVAKRSQPGGRVQGQRHERGDAQNSQQQSSAPDVGTEQQQGQENSRRQGESLRHRHQGERLDRQSGRPGQATCVAAEPERSQPGSSTLPEAGSGSMFHTRRIRSAQSSSPNEVNSWSSRCGARVASRTVAAERPAHQEEQRPKQPARRAGATDRLMAAVRPRTSSSGLVMSLSYPLHDVLGVRGVFQLHRDRRVVDPQSLDGLKVRRKVNHAPARRQVAVNLAIAIRDMHMRHPPPQSLD